MHNKLKLGILALVALSTGASAFSFSSTLLNSKGPNRAKAVFTYYVYATLMGPGHNLTRVITVNAIICPWGNLDCKVTTNISYITVGSQKLVPKTSIISVLSNRMN